ncbi:MAG: esterase family protein [Gemmataceae bacterium]|nr:esterase family protein [Gemmataceae bacterium]
MARHYRIFALVALPVVAAAATGQESRALTVQVTFTKSVLATPFTGRVFVIAWSSAPSGAPRSVNWFQPEPFFAMDVKDWAPDTPLPFRPTVGLPDAAAKLPPGKYYLQAVLDRDLGGPNCLTSAGNLYSKPLAVDWRPNNAHEISLIVDQIIPSRKFVETPRIKLVDIESKLLSAFHGKPMRMRAGVALPKSFADNPERKYPVIYEIPGFSGNHFQALAMEKRTEVADVEMIHVTLDPSCRLGHHVFADSANNGPCGRALVEELIPYLEKNFRGLGTPTSRFVTGHSSGGWSSLWLQITYPDFFGGVWSTAPDPVDFRDFQRVNIYEPGANLFFDAKGDKRPLARRGGKILLWYKPFSDLEVVMGRGGQLFSFEAVFSPRGADGKPRPLWDRATGAIDPVTAEAWKKYDIRLILETSWKTLGPKLAGKLHVYMGGEDTFYLDGAVRLLQQALKNLGSDAVIEIFPGHDHGSFMTAALRQRINQEMAGQFRQHHR